MWNNFDDDSTKLMDSVLAIEHEMAAVVLPDDAVGKHKITERLEVCWIGFLYYVSVEKLFEAVWRENVLIIIF